ncbi:hypothetical protein RRG08_051662 [Elysia crispata]|uniref:Uncharacterized protein n=1 Tax=Elysia crispata TaxID=231223 RepID=A0AAE1A2S0_9GAST|nr:hypothetical protein RRG08_051662 [Elysia crispata]
MERCVHFLVKSASLSGGVYLVSVEVALRSDHLPSRKSNTKQLASPLCPVCPDEYPTICRDISLIPVTCDPQERARDQSISCVTVMLQYQGPGPVRDARPRHAN